VIFLALACGPDGAGSAGASQATGEQLFKTQGCTTCHGVHAQGGPLAPALTGVAPYWTRDTLIAYLRDPQAYLKNDARLSAYSKKYSLPMTKFSTLSDEALVKIADYVLGLR